MAYGGAAASTTLLILLPLGVATVLAAHAIVARRAQIGGLRRQFVLLAVVAAAQLAIAVGVFVKLMFVSGHDAFFTVLVAAFTGVLGLWAGRLLGRRALADVDAVRTTLEAVAHGRRDVRTTWPAATSSRASAATSTRWSSRWRPRSRRGAA